MYDVKSINKPLQGSCDGIQATKRGKFVQIKRIYGSIREKVLFPIKYCPESEASIFSVTCYLSQGVTWRNDANSSITLKKDDELAEFNCQVKKKDSLVEGVTDLLATPYEAHVVLDSPHISSDVKDVGFIG